MTLATVDWRSDEGPKPITLLFTLLIVQEYIGETLKTYLEKETIADNTREADNTRKNANSHRKDLAHLLLQNVNTLHCEKYTHRDLKPTNLFVKTTLDGKPTKLFIGDYGLAVHSGRIRKPSFNDTYYYWGPEMNVSKHIHMQKVDSWSVGMILLELLYNAKPEPSSSFYETVVNKNNILRQNDIDTYLETKCTPDKCCQCCIDNHEHLKQIIHSLLLYSQKKDGQFMMHCWNLKTYFPYNHNHSNHHNHYHHYHHQKHQISKKTNHPMQKTPL